MGLQFTPPLIHLRSGTNEVATGYVKCRQDKNCIHSGSTAQAENTLDTFKICVTLFRGILNYCISAVITKQATNMQHKVQLNMLLLTIK